MSVPANDTESPGPTRTVAEPARIKRNTACVRCRDAKVKCNASLNPDRPCLRCSKLDLDCVVDKGHKRTSRKSKLEELAAEVRNIKEAVVASGPVLSISPIPPPLRPEQPSSPGIRQQSFINQIITPSLSSVAPNSRTFGNAMQVEPRILTPAVSSFATPSRSAGQTAEPRALASKVFSGEDIDYYFEKYFEHFHPFLPIVRTRDPDACYKVGSVLFWVIIVTACRRYARSDATFQFLVDSIESELWSAVAQPPVRPSVICALLILASWPLPNIRFIRDPTYLFTGIAMNACLYLGMHTGKSPHSEFGGPRYQITVTQEEATYAWAACNIVCQRASSTMGFPPTAPFSGHTLDMILDGVSPYSVPRGFAITLHAAKFSNRLMKTVAAAIEEASGISHHVLNELEDEFLTLKVSLHPGTPDIDDFTLRSVLLEIQVLYWMPVPNFREETLKRNLLKCYRTAESIIRLALDLERTVGFLSHAPNVVARTLLDATCVVMSFLRSPYSGDYGTAGDLLVQDALKAIKTCSVQDGDLWIRGPSMMEAYWSIRDRLPQYDREMGSLRFTHRFGASIVYDCIGRWSKEVERLQSAVESGPSPRPGAEASNSTALPTGPNGDLGLTDPLFQRIDWASFMDDFEWNLPTSYVGLGQP